MHIEQTDKESNLHVLNTELRNIIPIVKKVIIYNKNETVLSQET